MREVVSLPYNDKQKPLGDKTALMGIVILLLQL